MADAPDPLGRRSLFWATAGGSETPEVGREKRPLGKHAFYSQAPPNSRRNIGQTRGVDIEGMPARQKASTGFRGSSAWERVGLGTSGVLGRVFVDCSKCKARSEVGVGQFV